MGRLEFSLRPPEEFNRVLGDSGSLLQSPTWHDMLATAFGARTFYAWNAPEDDGFSITVFPAGPFRIGYVGFPIGGSARHRPLRFGECTVLQTETLPFRIDLIRILQSAFPEPSPLKLPGLQTMETEIQELQGWPFKRLSKGLRWGIKKAEKCGIRIKNPTEIPGFEPGKTMHRLYAEVVKNHGGSKRYGLDYFQKLLDLSTRESRVQCRFACIDTAVAAYTVVILEGQTAYYLHAASDMAFREFCAGDYLLQQAIVEAREKGMRRFNMLTSPISQENLVRYKEKWGGITRPHFTYELAINPIFSRAFKASSTLFSKLERFRAGRTST